MAFHRVSCDAEISVLQMRLLDRAVAKLAHLEMPEAPADQGQADLAADVFFSLYKGLSLRDPAPAERVVNQRLLEWAQTKSSWDDLARSCRDNLPVAMTAATFMWGALTSDEALQEALKRQQQAEEAEQQAQAAAMAAEVVQQMAAQQQMTAEEAEELARAAVQARAEADAKIAAAQKQMERIEKNGLRNATLVSQLREAGQRAQAVRELQMGWGFDAGRMCRTDPAQALAFVRQQTKKLQEIARMAGRLRGVGFQARRQRVVVGVDPTEVDYTRDVLRVMPTELARMSPLAPAGLREMQTVQFVEDGLLGWQLTGSQEERGPFVAGVDCSGSMRGEREIRAKGAALGLAQIARQDQRRYHLFSFSSDHDEVVEVSSEDGWEQHLAWGERFLNGGTSFDKALTVAMDRLAAMGETGRQADLLFISDGEAQVSPDVAKRWRAFAEESGARLMYVAVGGRMGLGSINALADKIMHFDQLSQEDADQLASEAGVWFQ